MPGTVQPGSRPWTQLCQIWWKGNTVTVKKSEISLKLKWPLNGNGGEKGGLTSSSVSHSTILVLSVWLTALDIYIGKLQNAPGLASLARNSELPGSSHSSLGTAEGAPSPPPDEPMASTCVCLHEDQRRVTPSWLTAGVFSFSHRDATMRFYEPIKPAMFATMHWCRNVTRAVSPSAKLHEITTLDVYSVTFELLCDGHY